MKAKGNNLIFLDNGDLKNSTSYAVGDSVYFSISDSSRFLACYSEEGELKFEKGEILLNDVNFPKEDFNNLSNEYHINCTH